MAQTVEQRKEYERLYRLKHKEKINNYHKNRRLASGKTIDISAYERLKDRTLTDETLGLRLVMTKAKTRANKYGREFDLDLDYVTNLWNQQKHLCNLSKIPMTLAINSGYTKASLDRIDSSRGYTRDNCQLVIAGINQLKLDLPQDEFIKICKAVANNN